MISAPDTEYWVGAPLETVDLTRDGDLRDGLVMSFKIPPGPDAVLVVRARNTPLGPFALSEFLGLQGDSLISWYRQLDKDENLQELVENWIEREGYLQIAVDIGGEWVPQGYFRDVGPNMPKTQVASLDLSGVRGNLVRLKLESARGLWELDRVALGNEAPVSGRVWEITASRARDRKGRDVAPELARADGSYYTALPGDTVELEFRAPPLPPPQQTRSILARTTGFYHMWTSHSGPSRPEIAGRILSEPLFGNRFLLLKWRASGGS
jgi:hypothetical protein